jgi:hypothetical protein
LFPRCRRISTSTPTAHGLPLLRRGFSISCTVSREDLVLSKLVWAKDSGSELQRRDVRTLLDDSMDRAYLDRWAARLGVAEALAEIAQ